MSRRAALALALAACGGGDKSSDKSAEAAPGFHVGTIDAAACNALVPAALKDKIVFEQRAITITRGHRTATYTLAVPKGWQQDMPAFADLKADDKGGFFSRFHVGTNCDGACTEKDWEPVADKATFQPHLKGATVVKDVKGAGTRTAIARDTTNTKVTDVISAWWKAGDRHYVVCDATLDPSIQDAAPAFERACSALTIDGED